MVVHSKGNNIYKLDKICNKKLETRINNDKKKIVDTKGDKSK